MEQPKYKRVLLKISGEALAGDASRGGTLGVMAGFLLMMILDVALGCVYKYVKPP